MRSQVVSRQDCSSRPACPSSNPPLLAPVPLIYRDIQLLLIKPFDRPVGRDCFLWFSSDLSLSFPSVCFYRFCCPSAVCPVFVALPIYYLVHCDTYAAVVWVRAVHSCRSAPTSTFLVDLHYRHLPIFLSFSFELLRSENRDYSIQRLLLGTHTAQNDNGDFDQNHVMIAEVRLPLDDAPIDPSKYDDLRGGTPSSIMKMGYIFCHIQLQRRRKQLVDEQQTDIVPSSSYFQLAACLSSVSSFFTRRGRRI